MSQQAPPPNYESSPEQRRFKIFDYLFPKQSASSSSVIDAASQGEEITAVAYARQVARAQQLNPEERRFISAEAQAEEALPPPSSSESKGVMMAGELELPTSTITMLPAGTSLEGAKRTATTYTLSPSQTRDIFSFTPVPDIVIETPAASLRIFDLPSQPSTGRETKMLRTGTLYVPVGTATRLAPPAEKQPTITPPTSSTYPSPYGSEAASKDIAETFLGTKLPAVTYPSPYGEASKHEITREDVVRAADELFKTSATIQTFLPPIASPFMPNIYAPTEGGQWDIGRDIARKEEYSRGVFEGLRGGFFTGKPTMFGTIIGAPIELALTGKTAGTEKRAEYLAEHPEYALGTIVGDIGAGIIAGWAIEKGVRFIKGTKVTVPVGEERITIGSPEGEVDITETTLKNIRSKDFEITHDYDFVGAAQRIAPEEGKYAGTPFAEYAKTYPDVVDDALKGGTGFKELSRTETGAVRDWISQFESPFEEGTLQAVRRGESPLRELLGYHGEGFSFAEKTGSTLTEIKSFARTAGQEFMEQRAGINIQALKEVPEYETIFGEVIKTGATSAPSDVASIGRSIAEIGGQVGEIGGKAWQRPALEFSGAMKPFEYSAEAAAKGISELGEAGAKGGSSVFTMGIEVGKQAAEQTTKAIGLASVAGERALYGAGATLGRGLFGIPKIEYTQEIMRYPPSAGQAQRYISMPSIDSLFRNVGGGTGIKPISIQITKPAIREQFKIETGITTGLAQITPQVTGVAPKISFDYLTTMLTPTLAQTQKQIGAQALSFDLGLKTVTITPTILIPKVSGLSGLLGLPAMGGGGFGKFIPDVLGRKRKWKRLYLFGDIVKWAGVSNIAKGNFDITLPSFQSGGIQVFPKTLFKPAITKHRQGGKKGGKKKNAKSKRK